MTENERLRLKVRYYKGYADRYQDIINEQKAEIERWKGLVEHFADGYTGYDSPSQMSEVAESYLNGTEDDPE